MSDIYKMKLHDEITIDTYNQVQRVPGGWIYKTECKCAEDGWMISSVFVPYNVEFKDTEL